VKNVEINKAEIALMTLYLGLFISIPMLRIGYAIYMKSGHIVLLFYQDSLIVLAFLPIFVGYTLKYFPKSMQKILCKKDRFIDVTFRFFDNVIKIYYFLIPSFIIFSIIVNMLDFKYMPILEVFETVLFSLVAFGLIYFLKMYYSINAKGYKYSWCKRAKLK